MTLIPYRQGDLWGYASPDKVIVIKPEYAEANLFYEGYASVKKGKMYGYIDKAGKVVIPFKFYSAKSFRFGYFDVSGNTKVNDGNLNKQKTVLFAGAAPLANGYEICIDTKGVRMPKCPAISENSAPDMNKSTTTISESNYSTIVKSDLFDKIIGDYKMPGMEDSYYIAFRNNNCGVFNNKFEVIVPFEYTIIKPINIGGMIYLMAEKNGMKGVLYGNGSPYIAVENTNVVYVHANNGKNYFIITKDWKTGIKDMAYQFVVDAIYADISYDTNGGFSLTGISGLKGYYFLNGYLLQPTYKEVKSLKGGEYLLIKTESGKTGYVNAKGDVFFAD